MNKRHAYLLMAYDQPELLKILIGLLDDSRNVIYIHLDRKAGFDEACLTGICRFSRLVCIPRQTVHWGGFSQMWTEVRLLQAAAPGHYGRYHLLSGRDLPLKSQDAIHAFFLEHPDAEFISRWPDNEQIRDRFYYWTLFPEGNRFFLTHALNNAAKSCLRALGIRQNADIRLQYGANWFSITDSCAQWVVSHSDWIRKTFRHCANPDELFLQTLVGMSQLQDRVTGEDLRWVDWSAGGRHPRTVSLTDRESLCRSTALFARKFDLVREPDIVRYLEATLSTAR